MLTGIELLDLGIASNVNPSLGLVRINRVVTDFTEIFALCGDYYEISGMRLR